MEKDELRTAAIEALNDLGITNAAFHDALPYQDSDRWSIQYREDEGQYYKVIVDPTEMLTREGTITQESMKKEIGRKLRERDPKDYMP